MKKFFRILLIGLFINLIFYIFVGQNISAKKLANNRKLNLYECINIYQMHCCVWMFGWVLSPEAAMECASLHFSNKDTIVINKIIHSPKIDNTINSLQNNQTKRVCWNGYQDYFIESSECRAALALNPCTITKNSKIEIIVSTLYPKYSPTKIDLKFCKIPLQEGLFRYLQDIGWLSQPIFKYTSGMRSRGSSSAS